MRHAPPSSSLQSSSTCCGLCLGCCLRLLPRLQPAACSAFWRPAETVAHVVACGLRPLLRLVPRLLPAACTAACRAPAHVVACGLRPLLRPLLRLLPGLLPAPAACCLLSVCVCVCMCVCVLITACRPAYSTRFSLLSTAGCATGWRRRKSSSTTYSASYWRCSPVYSLSVAHRAVVHLLHSSEPVCSYSRVEQY